MVHDLKLVGLELWAAGRTCNSMFTVSLGEEKLRKLCDRGAHTIENYMWNCRVICFRWGRNTGTPKSLTQRFPLSPVWNENINLRPASKLLPLTSDWGIFGGALTQAHYSVTDVNHFDMSCYPQNWTGGRSVSFWLSVFVDVKPCKSFLGLFLFIYLDGLAYTAQDGLELTL